MSTFSEEEAKNYCSQHGHSITEVLQVNVETLAYILDIYCNGTFPDFLSIDAEGLDEEILGQLKGLPSIPKVICTETWEYGLETSHVMEVRNILEPLGYTLFADNHLNSIFVLKELWEKGKMGKSDVVT